MFRLIATYFAGGEVCTASMASHFAINISKYLDAVIGPQLFRTARAGPGGAFIRSAQAANPGVAPRQRSVSDLLEERRIGAQRREILEEQREIALFAENV